MTDAVRPLVCAVTGGAKALRPVAREVVAWLVAHGLDPARAARVELAIHEVLANALEHGHLDDGSVPIGLRAAPTPVGFEVSVSDHALAGAWTDQPTGAPLGEVSSDRRPATRGRGLTLAASAVEAVGFHSDGERTVVSLRLESS